jgi:hypothetical protein
MWFYEAVIKIKKSFPFFMTFDKMRERKVMQIG